MDALTGIMDAESFKKAVNDKMAQLASDVAEYAMIYMDISGFKAINELFGRTEGDKILCYIAQVLMETVAEDDFVSRIAADRFAMFVKGDSARWEAFIESVQDKISAYELPYEITCHFGIYEVTEPGIMALKMMDRATLALSTIKDNYLIRFAYYTEELRRKMLAEREIVGMMAAALQEKQFVVYYQPQYSHSTGRLLGAEALVRWMNPEKGLISPATFIPIFEKTGFIVNLDLYVFEEVCRFLWECLDKKLPVVAISTNFSRYDIYTKDFLEKLEKIRTKYDIPVRLVHIEITESVMVGDDRHALEIIQRIHDAGYIVEMDDFGSGYSSLNVLKDLPLDVIKLDMLFLENDTKANRGGTILTSVVRMAKWLELPIIAEGVESIEQADFLRSIGCDYIQGYLYSKPIPKEEYVELISGSTVGTKVLQANVIETMKVADFWDPKSMETLIFNNFVGAASIFGYNREDCLLEMLRVNKKYLQELGMNLTEREIVTMDFFSMLDEANKEIFCQTLKRAIDTAEEQECETWWDITSECCGKERFCMRCNMRMIGQSPGSYLIYMAIRNITAEKRQYMDMQDNERRFKVASEQINIYFWEYSVATHEMHPCFRCMRDLGLPALVTNYPEPLIESCIFPPEIADDYRGWIKKLDSGEVDTMEGVVPLTVGRVPFYVRLSSERDENGRPIKVYGSATLVVD